jgi:diguanylate cyclase (GGDEF)-like protein/PAS domain S-box-containing protein
MAANPDILLLADATLRQSYDPVLVFDAQLVCNFANTAACEHLHADDDLLIGQHASAIFDASRCSHDIVPAMEQSLGGATSQFRGWHASNELGKRYFDLRITPLLRDGHIVGSIFTARDTTEQAIAEERARLAVIMFEHTTEGLIVLGADRRVRMVNPAFSQLTGYDAGGVVGESPDHFVSWRGEATNPYDDIWHALDYGHTWEGEVVYRRADGRLLPTWQIVVRVQDASNQIDLYLAVFTDLTERQRYEQQLERLVYYDVLTGMPNRALLADRAAQAIARAERYGTRMALLFIDLDRFKVINDTLGSNIGDQLLRGVAQRILAQASPGETASRYGADQFVLLLPEIDSPDQAATLARRLLDNLATPHALAEQTYTVTASIGIAVYPEDGEERETLVHHAETGMQAAKKAGRNAFRFFTQDMNQRSAEYLLLENYLRQGLVRNEFLLYYQPQIDIHTRTIIGFEALMRWRHPDLGLVPPNRFIPAAEESGLIVPMGQWALHEACRQNKAWQDAGLIEVPVSVNVSALQFAEALDQVTASSLQSAGLDAEWLELEVTESTLMESVNDAIHTLNTLKQMGVRLSIDDFGTGYSSLSYLKRFPLDKLKVDRSFVIDILTDPDDAAIAGAVISLAKNLRLRVIAEGVETAEQLAFLEQLGCDEMQGYLVAPALPADDIPGFIAQFHARGI